MKNNKTLIIIIIITILFISLGIFAFANNNNNTNKSETNVSATFYPLYDFTKNVGGKKINVSNITPAGAEPHDYEPTPQQLANANDGAIFVYNGAGLEPWVDNFLKTYKNTAVNGSQNIELLKSNHSHDNEQGQTPHAEEEGATHSEEQAHSEEEATSHADDQAYDPHYWLDPVLAIQTVNNIKDSLVKTDPANSDYYNNNANTYIKKLENLNTDFENGLKTCQTRTVVTSHDYFQYMAKRYNLNIVSISGLSPDAEPSTQTLAEISKVVKDKGINYIFFESLASPKLSETIARETGAQTILFNPLEGLTDEEQKAGQDYISVQKENLANLRTALACQ